MFENYLDKSIYNSNRLKQVKNIILTYRTSRVYNIKLFIYIGYFTVLFGMILWAGLGVSFAWLHGHSLVSVS